MSDLDWGNEMWTCPKCGSPMEYHEWEPSFDDDDFDGSHFECIECKEMNKMGTRKIERMIPDEYIETYCDDCGDNIIITWKCHPCGRVFCDECKEKMDKFGEYHLVCPMCVGGGAMELLRKQRKIWDKASKMMSAIFTKFGREGC